MDQRPEPSDETPEEEAAQDELLAREAEATPAEGGPTVPLAELPTDLGTTLPQPPA
ncbi:hypothetical protein ACN20G_15800 [Streptomyces sp. BI20]|uniref:hypothetical protein n=1 Tax=Streptomyces sp. BI20 TaxID=3403460 RepID=UPI003C74B229